MSQETNPFEDYLTLPCKGMKLMVDTKDIQLATGQDGQHLVTRNGALTWENMAASGPGFQYSTTEEWTGNYWIDGKKIYRKVVELGNLPNSGQKSVPSGIAGLNALIRLEGISVMTSGNHYPLPYAAPGGSGSVSIWLDLPDATVCLNTGQNRSTERAFAILEYTCTDR